MLGTPNGRREAFLGVSEVEILTFLTAPKHKGFKLMILACFFLSNIPPGQVCQEMNLEPCREIRGNDSNRDHPFGP